MGLEVLRYSKINTQALSFPQKCAVLLRGELSAPRAAACPLLPLPLDTSSPALLSCLCKLEETSGIEKLKWPFPVPAVRSYWR